MYVEELVDEEEYKRLLGDLTFDIASDHHSSTSSIRDVLDFEEVVEARAATAWESINSAILLGPSTLLKRAVPAAPPLQHTTHLTPLETEFLDRALFMHSQTSSTRQSFAEARRRVETDDMVLKLHREIRQRHRQHLNTIHSSLPKHLDDTKTALLREVVTRNKDTLHPTEWNGFFIVKKPEV